MNKTLKEMTPDEEQAYIDKINEDFRYFIDVAPFVEIGDTSNGQGIKLRAGNVHSGNYSIFEIIFELQYNLWRQQQRDPNVKKLIVSELSLTPEMSQDGFNPVRGLMIRTYYLKQNIDEIDKSRDRGCCSECGEGYDNEEEWLYNIECEVCGYPIPKHLIIKRP